MEEVPVEEVPVEAGAAVEEVAMAWAEAAVERATRVRAAAPVSVPAPVRRSRFPARESQVTRPFATASTSQGSRP